MKLLFPLIILFTKTVWGIIPEIEFQKAVSHTAFIFNHSLICHGTFFPHSKVVLTAGHCLDHVEAYDIDQLRVLTFKPIFPANQHITTITLGIRVLLGCLMEAQDPASCAYSLDHSIIPVTDKNNTPTGVMSIHRIHEIYIHPNSRRNELADFHSAKNAVEDSAVIMLKDSISFLDQSLNIATSGKNQFDDQTEQCFIMDWRRPEFILQTVRPISLKLFSHKMTQLLIPSDDRISFLMANLSDKSDIFNRLYPRSLIQSLGLNREQLKRWYSASSSIEKQIEAEKLFREWYNGLSTNNYFTLKYTEDSVWEGISGSPLWCYTPETGIFLRGHITIKMNETGIFFIRNFDRNLHTWVENLK